MPTRKVKRNDLHKNDPMVGRSQQILTVSLFGRWHRHNHLCHCRCVGNNIEHIHRAIPQPNEPNSVSAHSHRIATVAEKTTTLKCSRNAWMSHSNTYLVWWTLTEDMTDVRAGNDFQSASTHPWFEGKLEIFTTPNIESGIVGAQALEKFPVDWKQTSGHCWWVDGLSRTLQEKKWLNWFEIINVSTEKQSNPNNSHKSLPRKPIWTNDSAKSGKIYNNLRNIFPNRIGKLAKNGMKTTTSRREPVNNNIYD